MIEKKVMEKRYKRANTLLQGMYTSKLVQNDIIFPHWIEKSDYFWYQRALQNGKQYRLVSAKLASNEIAFDHQALAKALGEAVDQFIDADNLPLDKVKMILSPLQVFFTAFDKRWSFKPNNIICEQVHELPEHWLISPDGKYALFTRCFDLWAVDLSSGDEWPLTNDGNEDFSYAAEGACYGHSIDRWGKLPQACWSPDSTRIFTLLRNTTQVKKLPVIHHVPLDGSVRPKVKNYKIVFPEDTQIPEYHFFAIEVKSGHIQKVMYPGIPVLNNGLGYFNVGMSWWAADSRTVYFIDQTRDYKKISVIECNTITGETHSLFTESSMTNVSLAPCIFDYPQCLPLPETKELIWWSERSGWGHLYLYDLETGTLKNTITKGDWLVRQVMQFDAKRRELLIQTSGRIKGRDPYYRDLCKVNIDNGGLTSLLSSDHDYFVATANSLTVREAKIFGFDVDNAAGISSNGDFVVATYSRADIAPVSLLVDRHGNFLLDVEKADISNLPADWQWPEPVELLAADGKTDIYGIVYRPSDFSPEQSYPVLVCGYHCEAIPYVPKGSFSNGSLVFGSAYFHGMALAELGFIVVQIDGRGTPFRDKAFMDNSYGWANITNLDDEICGIHQLARRYPYLDLDRVGIICPIAGPGAVWALLKHPEFFKVGVTGEHFDFRLSPSMLGDKFNGKLTSDVVCQLPENLVDNLQGKLLLMSGMLDPGNPAACTFRLVEALQRANKDFDMILLPQGHHCVSNYQLRRAWDYLVVHLLGMEAPKEFNLVADIDVSQTLLKTDDKASS